MASTPTIRVATAEHDPASQTEMEATLFAHFDGAGFGVLTAMEGGINHLFSIKQSRCDKLGHLVPKNVRSGFKTAPRVQSLRWVGTSNPQNIKYISPAGKPSPPCLSGEALGRRWNLEPDWRS